MPGGNIIIDKTYSRRHLKDIEFLEGEGYREMIRRVWEYNYGSGSLTEEEITLIIHIGFAFITRNEEISRAKTYRDEQMEEENDD